MKQLPEIKKIKRPLFHSLSFEVTFALWVCALFATITLMFTSTIIPIIEEVHSNSIVDVNVDDTNTINETTNTK